MPLLSFAQDDYKARSEEYYQMGMEVFDYAHRRQATDMFLQAIEADPDNAKAYFMAGKSILFTINKEQSLPYFRRAFQLDQGVDNDILYYLGEAFRYSYQFDSAIASFLKYKYQVKALDLQRSAKLKQADRHIQECRKAKEMISQPVNVKITMLGPEVNSEYPDYAPTISGDGSILIFTSRRPTDNMNNMVADDYDYYEDIYYSRKVNDQWQPARNIGAPINTKFHDSNISLSADGKTMFLYKDGNAGDIFQSQLDANGKWTTPKELQGINTEYSESSASLSRDGKTLYFTSNRPGGTGGMDIYVASKSGDKWTKVHNLGPSINTDGDEEGVFLSSDGKSLFFSSDGYIGMGNFDLYRSIYDSISNSWGKPENLGYPINSVENDIYFVQSADGKYGYISSVRPDNMGYQDIYMLDMSNWQPFHETSVSQKVDTTSVVSSAPPVMSSVNGEFSSNSASISVNIAPAPGLPVEETYVELLVLDSISKKPITASVELLVGGVTIPFKKHDSGGFSTRFPSDSIATAGLRIKAAGYHTFIDSAYFAGMTKESLSSNTTILLSKVNEVPPAPPVTVVQLSTVYYGLDSDIPDSFDEIRKAIELLKATPSLKVEIDGYADSSGPDDYNLDLSSRRANFVKKYMAARGIDPSRIATVGFGETEPATSNDTKASRRLNRRITFRLIRPE